MNRYAVLIAVNLLIPHTVYGTEQTSTRVPEAITPDYKNRPDPCEVKPQKKQPANKAAAAKPAQTPKP
ncbi:MAG TPA: hypothetical protein VJS66_01045 [Burkholderiales bacterium]|nr:hypothetical protein [Burkholderiales bacterium]